MVIVMINGTSRTVEVSHIRKVLDKGMMHMIGKALRALRVMVCGMRVPAAPATTGRLPIITADKR